MRLSAREAAGGELARELAAHHRAVLEQGSAIDPAIIAERGYWTATDWQQLDGLRFRGTQKRPECFPALVIPQHDPSGEYTHSVIRYDRTPVRKNGDGMKYIQPAGVGLRLDVLPRCVPGLRDVGRPLWWTEGAKKADALASLGLVAANTPGVDGWRSPTAIPDLFGIPLKGRDVVCAYDSDILTKPAVRRAVEALAGWMKQKGAEVHVLDWARAELPGDAKVGVDDFLAEGRTLADLEGLVIPLDDWLGRGRPKAGAVPYGATDAGLGWVRDTREGPIRTPLTNFAAAIAADVAEDDGAEVRRFFEIEARLRGRPARFAVPADRFAGMGWAIEHLGSGAIVYPGFGLKDHARAAIQMLGAGAVERRVYAHTGWRELPDGWAYLHAGGAIGPTGPVPGVEVRLPAALGRYVLPDPPTADGLVTAIRSSAELLDVAPGPLTFPVYAAIWRAVLGPADFSLHLAGLTGVGKSELVALAAQHHGAGLDARHLPGSWSSTGNALEGLLFAGKDALVPIDDFAPNGSQTDQQRYHRDADRVFRAQGNNSGRLRMQADATLRAAKPPRGTVLSTGEDVPHGQSLRARLLVLEVEPGSIDWAPRLTSCQQDAAAGRYAAAMAGFLRWLAPRYEAVRASLPSEVATLRQAAVGSATHKRTPEIVANLAVGLRYFLSYAVDAGAFSPDGAAGLWSAAWAALGAAAATQAAHQAAGEPTRRFLELLGAAIASGRAHVAGDDGNEPDDGIAPSLGWRLRPVGTGEYAREEWQPQGRRVGWLTDDGLYLEPDAAFGAAQEMGNATRDGLAVAPKTLAKRLHERGLLVSTEQARGKLTARRTLERSRRNVLHLRADALSAAEPAQSAQSAAAETAPIWTHVGDGPILWADSASGDGKSAHENRPTDDADQMGANGSGPIGPIGPILGVHTAPLRNGTQRHTGAAHNGTRTPPPWRCACTSLERERAADGGWRCAGCGSRGVPAPEGVA